MLNIPKRRYTMLLLTLVALVIVGWLAIKPSNDRDWSLDQAVLPYSEINGDLITIHNIRNFDYRSTSDYTPAYYDKTFDLSKLKRVYYIVEPFSGRQGAAHTLLSFEFEGDEFVAVSVEIRKEKGEKFSAIKGLLKQYELMYVIADERDVVKLRANYRKDPVFVYPVKATPEKVRAVFLSMINRSNELRQNPAFYNTLWSNCTTNLAKHVNEISPRRVPWNLTLLLPAKSDHYAFDLGLIDTELENFQEVRAKHQINDLAEKYASSTDFSVRIREKIKLED